MESVGLQKTEGLVMILEAMVLWGYVSWIMGHGSCGMGSGIGGLGQE